MTNIKINYPLLESWQMPPPDQMILFDENKLSPLRRAELNNLRKGDVRYSIAITDTPENRRNLEIFTLYYQQVAYKEGWQFKPENWQVEYISPNDPRFPHDGNERRMYRFKKTKSSATNSIDYDGNVFPLSQRNRIGFRLHSDTQDAEMMVPQETDDLSSKVIRLFNRS